MNALAPYVRKYWKPVLLSLFFLACETVCDLLQPTIMAHLVDRGIASRNLPLVLQLAGWMLLVTAAGAVGAVSRNIISSIASTSLGADLRAGIFRRIQTFSFASVDRFETGSLVTRLTSDVNQVQFFFHGIMRIFAKAPLMAIGSVVMAVMLNPRMSLVLVAIIPVVAAIIAVNLRLGYPLFIRVQEALDRVNAVTQGYLAGVRVVKAFNRYDYERSRFATANEGLAATTIRAMRVMASFGPAVGLTLNLGIIAVLWLGGVRVNRGDMHVGEIIAFINYMSHIMFSLMMISVVITMFARARASAARIAEVLAEQPGMPLPAHPRAFDPVRTGVRFDGVSFNYGAAPVLSGITFSVEPGETVGIIGSTGSGKTSLMHLLPRFYDVASGSVSVGGVDVREADTARLRESIAIVPQKTTLFTGTIMENIRWGRASATRAEVEQAAAVAQAHDFITSFPEGYDTVLGQGGVNLSGGQKQRIAIARALVRQPSILILDDCTSSVDGATESRIRAALAASLQGLTAFVITQRVTSVMGMRRILVLENGAIAGLGDHATLVKTCDVYRDIFRSQVGSELP